MATMHAVMPAGKWHSWAPILLCPIEPLSFLHYAINSQPHCFYSYSQIGHHTGTVPKHTACILRLPILRICRALLSALKPLCLFLLKILLCAINQCGSLGLPMFEIYVFVFFCLFLKESYLGKCYL